jgi:queuine tRNA-ribosyltransferase
MKFTVLKSSGLARYGFLELPHGSLHTPAFMPVGTTSFVKAVLPQQLEDIGYRLVLSNTYHLYLRPGLNVIERMGGLHSFASWKNNILTDSGGFQAYSLASNCKIKEDGIEFRSHVDGQYHFFTPKGVLDAQEVFGSDIRMLLDVCPKLPCTEDVLKAAVEKTINWARISEECQPDPKKGVAFAIVQGGTSLNMREYCANELIKLDFPGYAIGGLAVGESHAERVKTVDHLSGILPYDKPRYLMGIGKPEDILDAISLGVDMFDCVLPTRNARNGQILTWNGQMNIRNACYEMDDEPIDKACTCPTCKAFSRGYLRHLNKSKEILASILLTLHNLHFYYDLCSAARESIEKGVFSSFREETMKGLKGQEGYAIRY